LLDRQIGGLRALQDFVHEDCCARMHLRIVGPVIPTARDCDSLGIPKSVKL
jgi:hypothetical protein